MVSKMNIHNYLKESFKYPLLFQLTICAKLDYPKLQIKTYTNPLRHSAEAVTLL